MADPLTNEDFAALMPDLTGVTAIAAAVSGGPDSMALVHLLNDWAAEAGVEIHALTVDHGLRPEAKQEAAEASSSLKVLHCVKSNVLEWTGEKPEVAIQEEARKARYDLMASYCKEHDIRHLFLAHHQNDQAETFLFRLAKGSGLDGLAAMMPVQKYDDDLSLLRPLLEISKERLIATCENREVAFVEDPSNESEDFARVRLRKSQVVLEQEGLSAKRLSITAKRIGRARQALETLSDGAFDEISNTETNRIVLNLMALRDYPDEIGLRVMMKALLQIGGQNDYGPRLEKIERLFDDVMGQENFPRQTLGGTIVERDDKNHTVVISKEKGR